MAVADNYSNFSGLNFSISGNSTTYVNDSDTSKSQFNISNVTVPEVPEFPRYMVVTSTVLFIFIFLLGVLGNILVMTVVCCNRNMKTSVNMYLMNLCTADLLLLTVCMPTALADLYTKEAWYFGAAMCKLVPFFENTVANASVMTILAISIERYRVVCEPLKGIGADVRKVAKIIGFLWTVSACSSIPSLYIARLKQSSYLDGTPIMVCRNPVTKKWQKTYLALLATFYFALPFFTLLAIYCRVCYVLHRKRNKMNVDLNEAQQYKDRKRLRVQVINIISSIVVLFFICHLPFRVIGLWMIFENKHVLYGLGIEKYFNILYFGRIMFYLNHAINPIIYNFVSTKFRSTLRHMLSRGGNGGSFMSSNRRRTLNNIYTRPRLTRQARRNMPDNVGDGSDVKIVEKSSSSSSSRQNRNEFFPMYAHIIERSSQNQDQQSGAENSNNDKCSLHIKLVDKSVAFTFNLRKKNRCSDSSPCWCG